MNTLINWLNSLVGRYSEGHQSRNAMQELAKFDARMLEDIGIDRADVTRITMTDKVSVDT